MKTLRIFKTLLVASSALVLASCGADEVASPGEGAFNPAPGSGGGGGGTTPPPGTPATDCPTGFANVGTVAGGTLRNCQLPNLITGALTVPLRAGTVYSLSGRVDVGVDRGGDGATGAQGVLTVEAGVRIFGSGGLDYLVINRGSQIFATGTPTNPVIFTSRNSIEGTTTIDSIGQWGGIVILGRAPISNCPGATPAAIYGMAACQAQVEGTNAFYGGNAPTDNSGSLQYVRVMHSGFEVLPGNELNGITFAGVGSGTIVDYVQVHNSSDDGIEWFGGNVNAKHLVLTGNDDDSLDTDQGFNGALQYVIVVQRPNGGNRIVEASMAALATGNPRSRPIIANFTFVGSNSSAHDNVMILNTGTDYRFYNGVATTSRAAAACLDIDNQPDTTAIFRSVFMSCATPFNSDADDEASIFNSGTNVTSAGTSTLTNGFVNGANETAVPVVTFASLSNTELPTAIKSFLTQTDYIGAVKNSTDTWYAGWTCGLPGGTAC